MVNVFNQRFIFVKLIIWWKLICRASFLWLTSLYTRSQSGFLRVSKFDYSVVHWLLRSKSKEALPKREKEKGMENENMNRTQGLWEEKPDETCHGQSQSGEKSSPHLSLWCEAPVLMGNVICRLDNWLSTNYIKSSCK